MGELADKPVCAKNAHTASIAAANEPKSGHPEKTQKKRRKRRENAENVDCF